MPETHRLCINIPYNLYLQLKSTSSTQYRFQKGYTKKAVIASLQLWVWMVSMDDELKESLKKIGEKEFPEIEDPIERHEAVILKAITEFINNHNID